MAVDLLQHKVASNSTWEEYVEAVESGKCDNKLHLGLMPIPFLGNVANARVILLLQNPGLAACDYFAEFKVEGFAARLEQAAAATLNPDHANGGGARIVEAIVAAVMGGTANLVGEVAIPSECYSPQADMRSLS